LERKIYCGITKTLWRKNLNKLRQNFGTNDIPFSWLTFGQLFRIVKTEGLNLCNEIKIQCKYGYERAQSRKEMGTFCKAFGLTKIEAPSTAHKRIQKKRAQPRFKRPPRQPKPFVKKEQSKPTPKKKQSNKKKKTIVCYKCGKIGHKAFQCKTEQKINELFFGELELQKKLLALLAEDASDSDREKGYYSRSSKDSAYESSPIQSLNVITSKPQKEFLLDLIGQISDIDTKREYL